MFHGPDEPVYTISVAARLLGVTPQVLRQIEHEGLIEPRRTESNIRLYSENDLRKLQKIIHLLRDKGINAAGVRFILAAEEEARSERWTGPPMRSVRQAGLSRLASEESRPDSRDRRDTGGGLLQSQGEEGDGDVDASGETGAEGRMALTRHGGGLKTKRSPKSWRDEDGV
ncbi:MAG: MerR family transcriptional regulator [Firmicutes bacterium]|nr:MerR family transcriptional regulator [Candidatus Fermentithermobacillaceae bacterium]